MFTSAKECREWLDKNCAAEAGFMFSIDRLNAAFVLVCLEQESIDG